MERNQTVEEKIALDDLEDVQEWVENCKDSGEMRLLCWRAEGSSDRKREMEKSKGILQG